MKIIIFIDLENFKKSLEKLNRRPQLHNLPHAILGNIAKQHGWERFNPRLIRAYAYTGIYTDSIIRKMITKWHSMQNSDKKEQLKEIITKTRAEYQKQRNFLNEAYRFLEIRTKPLKYERNSIFQKGIDVQLAVDLVSHAHQNNFDAAVVCSGDLDLLESLVAVKNLGKKIILISHPENVSKKMIQVADSFIDLSKLSAAELDTFSERGVEDGIY